MGAILGSVSVTGFIATTDSTDTYAVIDPLYGIDGLRSVADHPTRDAITNARRRQGMIVYTRNDSQYWVLGPSPWSGTDSDWSVLVSGASSLTIGSGPAASLPSPSGHGNLYFPTDSVYIYRDTGSEWQNWGRIYSLVPPTNNLIAVNSGSAAYSSVSNGGVFYGISQAGIGGVDVADFTIRMWVQSAPSTPYTLTMGFEELMSPLFTFGYFGIVLRNSSSGELITLSRGFNGGWVINQSYYDTPTSADTSQTGIDINHPHEMMRFLRVNDDGTTRSYSCSNDGQNFLIFKQESSSNFITPDQIGVFVQQTDSAETGYGMFLTHWLIS